MKNIKTLNNFKAASSIRAQLNALNKTTEVMAVIGQNIVAQLIHGNTNHLTSMIEGLKNKDNSLNKYAKDIMSYVNAHDGLKVTYSAKSGKVKVIGKPVVVNCYADYTKAKEAEKAQKSEEAKAKREESKANKGNEADIKEQAEKLAKALKGYTLEQVKQIMLMAEQNLIADIIAEQEKTDGIELPSLETPFKEAV